MGTLGWSNFLARTRIHYAIRSCGLDFSERKYRLNDDRPREQTNHHWIEHYRTDGVILAQHKNTWKRKRESAFLIKVEYYFENKIIMTHVEPWVKFPSDELVAKLTLLPRKVDQK